MIKSVMKMGNDLRGPMTKLSGYVDSEAQLAIDWIDAVRNTYYEDTPEITTKVPKGLGVIQFEAAIDVLLVPPTIMLKSTPA